MPQALLFSILFLPLNRPQPELLLPTLMLRASLRPRLLFLLPLCESPAPPKTSPSLRLLRRQLLDTLSTRQLLLLKPLRMDLLILLLKLRLLSLPPKLPQLLSRTQPLILIPHRTLVLLPTLQHQSPKPLRSQRPLSTPLPSPLPPPPSLPQPPPLLLPPAVLPALSSPVPRLAFSATQTAISSKSTTIIPLASVRKSVTRLTTARPLVSPLATSVSSTMLLFLPLDLSLGRAGTTPSTMLAASMASRKEAEQAGMPCAGKYNHYIWVGMGCLGNYFGWRKTNVSLR
ncbi:hypothetical protein FVEG_07821 [Fusarium verticillioides 7600]|uniref:Uncharacterized protein n=1 Tax=Gibberella moniliformis (strain M3125 / FGSC 7600) TaxID=334819 RepID=W7M895_GIBM7|nr:hypothetical protein FVEG_07821 [Fusarium verticillioides 7600]EWG47798.1 hypothetical protein FVEG_07821 [Fusarium verticillioides 7600]